MEYKQPAWLDDTILVTKGDVKKHEAEITETRKKLENAGYRLNLKKCQFFKQEIEWVGHKVDQQGIRPLQDKLEAKKINTPENEKEGKFFLGAIHYLSKDIENLSANTDILRNFLKSNRYLERATEITVDSFVSPAVITVKKDRSIKIWKNQQNERNWTKKHTNAFNKLTEHITNYPCLTHYNANEKQI